MFFILFFSGGNDPFKVIATGSSGHQVRVSSHGGFVIPHSKELNHLSRGHFVMNHLSFSRQTTGRARWHQMYGYPYTGIDLIYTNLGYPEVLGSALAVFPQFAIKQAGNETFGFYTRYGLGLAYLTHYWDKDENFRNVAIGSPYNVVVNLSLEFQWRMTNRWLLHSGLSLTHFSNGRTRRPNKGINIAALKFGVGYQFQNKERITSAESLELYQRNPRLQLIASTGLSGNYPPGSPFSQRYSLSSTANFPIRMKYRLGAGYDFMAFGELQDLQGDLPGKQFYFSHGIHIAFYQYLSRASFFINKGFYLDNPDPKNENTFYHRAGFSYLAYGGLLIHVAIRTHFMKADHIEFGLGFQLEHNYFQKR